MVFYALKIYHMKNIMILSVFRVSKDLCIK